MGIALDHFNTWAYAVITAASLPVSLQATATETAKAIYYALEQKKREAIAAQAAAQAAQIAAQANAQQVITEAAQIVNTPSPVVQQQVAPVVTPVNVTPANSTFDYDAWLQRAQAEQIANNAAYVQAEADAQARFTAQVQAEQQRQAAQTKPAILKLNGLNVGVNRRKLTILDFPNRPNGAIDGEFAHVLNGIESDGKRISEQPLYTMDKLL